ncbi:MAG: signal peptidase I [Saccharofermentanales bacterium]
MKTLNRLIDFILYFIAAAVLTAVISSILWNRPVLFSAVRSDSMSPLFERGDVVFVDNLNRSDPLSIGDIVLFKAEEGELSVLGYVAHRIIGGNKEEGYTTRGDANHYSDQETGSPLIKREWIVSRIAVRKGRPVRIPLLGYLSIWMEGVKSSRYTLPAIAVLLIGVVCIGELKNNSKGKIKKKNKAGMQQLYFFSGLTISIILATLMLTSSHKITFLYEVSSEGRGAIMGSSVGIVNIGDERQLSLANIRNNGIIPLTAVITAQDSQLRFSHVLTTLKKGDTITPQVFLKAREIGYYSSNINIGVFYPFLPRDFIYFLASISYWLALAAVSLVPGLPLMIYPVINRTMRRQTLKKIRRNFHLVQNRLPVN